MVWLLGGDHRIKDGVGARRSFIFCFGKAPEELYAFAGQAEDGPCNSSAPGASGGARTVVSGSALPTPPHPESSLQGHTNLSASHVSMTSRVVSSPSTVSVLSYTPSVSEGRVRS